MSDHSNGAVAGEQMIRGCTLSAGDGAPRQAAPAIHPLMRAVRLNGTLKWGIYEVFSLTSLNSCRRYYFRTKFYAPKKKIKTPLNFTVA